MTEILNKWDILGSKQVNWKPHAKQEEIVSSDVRNRVVSAGRRFGKSDIGGHELLPEAFATFTQKNTLAELGKRREFWIVGPEYSDSEKEFRVIYNECRRLDMPFDRPGTYNNPETGLMHISLWGGTFQISAKSAKHPETLVGEGLNGVIMAEAAKLKERVWTKFIRPTLADYKGWALLSSTPEGKNWYYDLYQAGQDPKRTDWKSWRCPSWLNPYVYKRQTNTRHVRRLQEILGDPKRNEKYGDRTAKELIDAFSFAIDEEILSLMEDLTEEAFNQEIAALFTDFVGRVFKDFDEETHVGEFKFSRDPYWTTYGAVDYGFTNPNVWLLIQMGRWGEIRVIDELYEKNLTAQEFALAVKGRGLCPDNLVTFYPDPASPGDTRQMEQVLGKRASGGTGGELKNRIDAIRLALKVPNRFRHLPEGHVDRVPQLMFDRGCKMCIYEFGEYRYPERRGQATAELNSQEAPMKKDDHTPEALGRFFAGKLGTPDRRSGRTVVRSAKVRG